MEGESREEKVRKVGGTRQVEPQKDARAAHMRPGKSDVDNAVR